MKILTSILFLLSYLLSNEIVTQVTEIYPDGTPKEITIYAVTNDLSSNNPLRSLQKYFYDKDGNLNKYREWSENGIKSKELQIYRGTVIERNWDINGAQQKIKKFSQDDYKIPTVKNNNQKDEIIDQLFSEINQLKKDISNNYKLVSKIASTLDATQVKLKKITDSLIDTNELNKIKNEMATLSSLYEDKTIELTNLHSEISIIDQKISELDKMISELNLKSKEEESDSDYKSWKKNNNKKIEDLKQEIRTLKNEIKQIKKMID